MSDLSNDGTLVPQGVLTGNFDGNESVLQSFSFNGSSAHAALFTGMTGNGYAKAFNLLNVSVTNASDYTGGFMGQIGNSPTLPSINNILVTGYVRSTTQNYVGLLAGGALASGTGNPVIAFSNCITIGRVSSSVQNSGGMVGIASALSGATSYTYQFSNLFNAANVSSTTTNTGGVMGDIVSRGTVTMSQIENRGYISGVTNVGGLFGTDNIANGSIVSENLSSLVNYGNIKGTNTAVAGIIGNWANYVPGIMDNLRNYGNVSSTQTYTGGLLGQVGLSLDNASLTITHSLNAGQVVSTNTTAGGLIGTVGTTGAVKGISISISTSANTGDVQATHFLGGVMGTASFGSTGVAPTNNTFSITSTSNAGTITATDALGYAGGIIGYYGIGSFVADVTLNLDNDSSSAGTISCAAGGGYCGGIAGRLLIDGTKSSTLNNCTSNSPVIGSGAGGNVGGLIGSVEQANGATTFTVSNSSTNATISATTTKVGGLVGYVANTSGTFLITTSHSAGTVSSTSSFVGGLVGNLSSLGAGSIMIERSYSTAAISANQYAGGLFGQAQMSSTLNSIDIRDNYSTSTVYATIGCSGGIAGTFFDATSIDATNNYCQINLDRNYSSSIVTAGSGVVSGIGPTSKCTLHNTATYWLKDTGLNAGLADDTFQRPVYDLQHLTGQGTATYSGWDFSTVWNTFSPGSYPTLR
jgi:hypothetical protein